MNGEALWYTTNMDENAFYRLTKEGSLSGAYLLHGAEELTKRQAVDRVRALLDPAFADMNVEKLTMPDAATLGGALARVPLFDKFRLLLINEFDAKTLEPLLPTLTRPIEGTVVLFILRGEAKTNSSFYKAFAAADRTAEFPQLTQARAVNMLQREAALRGVGLERSVALRLNDMVGADAYRLQNEFSKAADYVGRGGSVTTDTLTRCVTPSPEYDVFSLLNCFLNGRKGEGLRLFRGLLRTGGESALALSYFLEGRLKLMLLARECLDARMAKPAAIKHIGGNPRAAEIALNNAKKCSVLQLTRAVAAFAEIDAKQKQGLVKDEDALMAALVSCF